jgi:hypothetical protein
MSSSLSFTYQWSGDPNDDFGWLGVTVVSERSSGRGGFWVQWQDVKEFGEKLATYPISPEAPVEAEWGYEPWEGNALVVKVEILPAGRRGDLAVKVWLRDHIEMGEGEPSECLRTSFITHYPQLEAFRLQIADLMDRRAQEAKLLGG